MATVCQDGTVKNQPMINVSCRYSDPSDVELHVGRYYENLPNEFGGVGKFKYCDGHKKRFSSTDEAFAYALERGYLQVYYRKRFS